MSSHLRAAPYVLTAAAVALLALAAHLLTRLVPLPHVSILFLAAVVGSAALWGFWPSLFGALLSVAAGSFFFYAPVFSFRVAERQDLADLVVFILVAAFTSRLAAGARAQALTARRRQETMASLLALSERVAASTGEEDLNGAIVEHLARLFGRPAYLLLAGPDGIAPAAGGAAPPPELRAAAARVLAGEAAALPGWRLERLATAQGAAGVFAAPASDTVDPEHAKALLGQAALAIEQSRLRREIAEARVAVQGERLREALLNSMSHDLQTPLAAILGSATALESLGEQAEARTRRELVAGIRDEAERLASTIENVLDLSRIRAGPITPRLELVELSDIILSLIHI